MKRITFKEEKLPNVQYGRDELRNELRDKSAQYLVKLSLKKLTLGEISSNTELVEYVSAIFQKALGPKLSHRELENIESMHTKFSFLQYHKTSTDNTIHGLSHDLMALCSGDKKKVESFVSPWPILDEQGNVLSLRRGLDWEYSKALRDDVANLARECIREFLEELRDTGRIMTSAELGEYRLSLATLDMTEEDESYSNDEFESDTDANDSSTSTKDASTTDNSAAHCVVQKRAASGATTDEKDGDKTKDIITVETENSSSHLDIALNNLINWIYELPEWLQEQVLNSAPIKLLIESAEQQAAIYNKNTVASLFAKLLSTDIANNSADAVEDDINAKATVADTSLAESIDTSMILNEPTVTVWILPTVAIDSGNLFGDYAFNDLLQVNGLNGIDVF